MHIICVYSTHTDLQGKNVRVSLHGRLRKMDKISKKLVAELVHGYAI
jgi:hypothetical protein